MLPHYVPMPISHNLGIKCFPRGRSSFACHHILRGPLKLPSVLSCWLFLCCHLLQLTDTCIHLSYFFYRVAVCLCFVWNFCTSQLLSNMLTSIIYPSACGLGESAACWSAANMDFCFRLSALEYERQRPWKGSSGFLQALWSLAFSASRGFVSMWMCWCSSHLPSSAGCCGGKGCAVPRGALLLPSRHHCNRAVSSGAFSLPGGACKTKAIFWVQFGVLVFQWGISIVPQEFVYLFVHPFIYNPNALPAYCSKNCQSDRNALNVKDLGGLNENSLDYSVSLVRFVLFQAWVPTITAATGLICAVLCCGHLTNGSKFSRRVCSLPLAAVAVGKLISLQCRVISKGTPVLFCYKDTHLFPSALYSCFFCGFSVFHFSCTCRGLTIPKG